MFNYMHGRQAAAEYSIQEQHSTGMPTQAMKAIWAPLATQAGKT